MKPIFWYFLFFFLIKIYRVNGVHIKGRCVSFINNKLNIINHKTYKSTNPLFCYKKRVKAKELRKLTTEELEKEIIKCRLDIQKFQQQGFYDIHNYNVFYEKNARRKLAQLLTIYYQRYLDNNIRIKS